MGVSIVKKTGRGKGRYSGTNIVAFSNAILGVGQGAEKRVIRALGWLGHRGKIALYQNFLRGKELNIHGGERAKDGRRKYMYRLVPTRGEVVISAFVLNPHDRGRVAYGKKQKGKDVFSKKLPPHIKNIMGQAVSKFKI